MDLQLEVMLRGVITLLTIGIVIALVGIGNSLGLSVLGSASMQCSGRSG